MAAKNPPPAKRGRGTAEGGGGGGGGLDLAENARQGFVVQHASRRKAKHLQASGDQPSVSRLVVTLLVRMAMALAVDLDGQARGWQ